MIILTYNEEIHLARALESVASFADEVVVVDSFSTDRTSEIAASSGARFLSHTFRNQADQFQWALDNAGIANDWILRLDADEIIEADLADRIRTELPALPEDVAGVTFDRKHIFMGRWVRHGGRYPLTMLRLFRRGQGRIEQRWMDEHIIVEGGRVVRFAGGFADHNLHDLSFFTDKHNKYATREAVEVLTQRHQLLGNDGGLNKNNASFQASLKRLLKEKIYNRLPFWLGPLGYFLYRYFIQLGFLDGREGLIYHFLQGFWYRFLVGAKVVELERALAPINSREEKVAALAKLTGLKLRSS